MNELKGNYSELINYLEEKRYDKAKNFLDEKYTTIQDLRDENIKKFSELKDLRGKSLVESVDKFYEGILETLRDSMVLVGNMEYKQQQKMIYQIKDMKQEISLEIEKRSENRGTA